MSRMNPLMARAFDHLKRLLADQPTLRNQDIAPILGVTAHTVGRWRRELGIANRRDRLLSTPAEREAAVARVQAGESIGKVALDIGRQASSVYTWCRAAGITSTHRWHTRADATTTP